MTKDIQVIDALYPIDSQFTRTNAIGEQLLIESIREFGWKNLPAELLSIYRAKCERECYAEQHKH